MNHNWGFTKSTFFIKCRVRDFFVCLEFLLCFFDKHIRFTKKKKELLTMQKKEQKKNQKKISEKGSKIFSKKLKRQKIYFQG